MKTQIKLLVMALIATFSFSSCMTNPMACCDIPTSGAVGESLSFNSDCSMDASSFEWDFGDGTTSTEANVTHTYNTAGSYTVTLMATSKNGKKMDETTNSITIN